MMPSAIDARWLPDSIPADPPIIVPAARRGDPPEVVNNDQRAFWTAAYPPGQQEDLKPEKIYAFLNPLGTSPGKVNTANTSPVYAIVGNGFVATVNHSTLLQTRFGRDRIGTRKIQHLGFPDPWLNYHPHNMNQHVELLTLPGYVNHPDSSGWLRSEIFAATNQAEVGDIPRSPQEPEIIAGQVTKIEKSGDNYALTIRHRKTKVIASHIDICTGPGQTRVLNLRDVPADLLKQYRYPPKEPTLDGYLQLLTATNFTWEHARVVPNGLMLVLGRGPAAAQAVERALEAGGSSQVLWSPKVLADGFPPTLRLDHLVKQPNGEPLPKRLDFPNKLVPALVLWPNHDKLFVTQCAWEISRIEALTEALITSKGLLRNDRRLALADYEIPGAPPLLVTFTQADPNQNAYIDSRGPGRPSRYGIFHQIVIAAGVQDQYKEPGSTFALLQDALIDGGIGLKPLISGKQGLGAAVGLESEDGRFRVLGAAGHGNGLFATLTGDEGDKLVTFEGTLPAQARIAQQGVTLSALTTSYANRYFKNSDSARNPSVNTACLSDLKFMAGDGQLGLDLQKLRIFRIAPFKDLDTLAGAVVLYRQNVTMLERRQAPPVADPVYDRFVAHMNTDSILTALLSPDLDKLKRQLRRCKFVYEVGDYSARR